MTDRRLPAIIRCAQCDAPCEPRTADDGTVRYECTATHETQTPGIDTPEVQAPEGTAER